MAIGMTYDDFWYGDLELPKYYREAHELQIKQKNEELWLQGLYIHNAFAAVMANIFAKRGAKKEKYLEKPIDLFPKNNEEKANDRKQAQERMNDYLKSWQKNWTKLYGSKNK